MPIRAGLVAQWPDWSYDAETGVLRDMGPGGRDLLAPAGHLPAVGAGGEMVFAGDQRFEGSMSGVAAGSSLTLMVLARFMPTTMGSGGLVCLSDNGATNRSALLFRWDGDDDIIFRVGPLPAANNPTLRGFRGTDWCVWTCVHETGQRSFACNGAPAGSRVEDRSLLAPTSIRIGCLHPDGIPLIGDIAEVVLWDRVLTISELRAEERRLAARKGVSLAD